MRIMKLKEMIELIQMHHQHIGETEIVKLLNRAKDDFCEETQVFKMIVSTLSSVSGTWCYSIPSGLTKIEEVYLNDVRIPRLQGNPLINDET